MNQKIKDFLLDLFFPKFCVSCQKEGEYLCPDCFSLIEIPDRQYCPFCQNPTIVFDGKTCPKCKRTHNLNGLFCAASYDNFIVKKLIHLFKYKPYIKDISETLACLIIAHLAKIGSQTSNIEGSLTSNNPLSFNDYILVPVPVHKKKLKVRGFNPAEEIAKHLVKHLKIPLLNHVLLKTKKTLAQTDLKKEERIENVKGVFSCLIPEIKQVENKKILLVDDVFTTGSTIEECAKTLKQSGIKEVWGIVVARG